MTQPIDPTMSLRLTPEELQDLHRRAATRQVVAEAQLTKALSGMRELLYGLKGPLRTHYTDWDTYLCTSCYAEEAGVREDLKHEEDCRWTQIDKLLKGGGLDEVVHGGD